jgi:hypothetical protein
MVNAFLTAGSEGQHMSHESAENRLRVIDGGASVVNIGEAALSTREGRLLMAEADALEAWIGPNAYSYYLRKRGERPGREEAAAIGRLLGGRVEAADGSLQPPLTAADRAAIRAIKSRRAAASRRYDHILRLQQAIAALAENEDDPADVIGEGSCLLNEQAISAQLGIAVCWLTRFEREWHERAQRSGARGSDAAKCDQRQVGL